MVGVGTGDGLSMVGMCTDGLDKVDVMRCGPCGN